MPQNFILEFVEDVLTVWREGCAYLGKENGEEKPKKLAAGGQRDEPSITLCHTLSYFAIFGAFLEWAFLDCSLLFAIYYLLWSSISARLGSLEAPTGPLQLFGAVRFRELFASISCNTEFLEIQRSEDSHVERASNVSA